MIPVIHIDQEENGKLLTKLNLDLSSAEFGIVVADIFKHFERSRGREFAASVFAMFYKELARPTSKVTDITIIEIAKSMMKVLPECPEPNDGCPYCLMKEALKTQ